MYQGVIHPGVSHEVCHKVTQCLEVTVDGSFQAAPVSLSHGVNDHTVQVNTGKYWLRGGFLCILYW